MDWQNQPKTEEKTMKKFFLCPTFLAAIFCISLLFSCTASTHSYVEKQRPSLPDNQHVTVFGLSDMPPANSQTIGFISTGVYGMMGFCGYNESMGKAIKECRKLGGNALKITSVGEPDLFHSCYRIQATALYINESPPQGQYQYPPQGQ